MPRISILPSERNNVIGRHAIATIVHQVEHGVHDFLDLRSIRCDNGITPDEQPETIARPDLPDDHIGHEVGGMITGQIMDVFGLVSPSST